MWTGLVISPITSGTTMLSVKCLARVSGRCVHDFKIQELANIVWVFAKACQLGASLGRALARAAERCVDDFNSQ